MIRFFDAWDSEIIAQEKEREFYPIEKYYIDDSGTRKENTSTYNPAEAEHFADDRANTQNISQRRLAYGTLSSQLDEMYHDIDAWKARIKSIKDKYPKKKKE